MERQRFWCDVYVAYFMSPGRIECSATQTADKALEEYDKRFSPPKVEEPKTDSIIPKDDPITIDWPVILKEYGFLGIPFTNDFQAFDILVEYLPKEKKLIQKHPNGGIDVIDSIEGLEHKIEISIRKFESSITQNTTDYGVKLQSKQPFYIKTVDKSLYVLDYTYGDELILVFHSFPEDSKSPYYHRLRFEFLSYYVVSAYINNAMK